MNSVKIRSDNNASAVSVFLPCSNAIASSNYGMGCSKKQGTYSLMHWHCRFEFGAKSYPSQNRLYQPKST